MQDISPEAESQTSRTGVKLAVFALAVAVAGLPINDVAIYAALALAAVAIFTGTVRVDPRRWGAAAAVVAVAIGAQVALAPPRIDEGFNVFLPGGVLERDLPADVYRHMAGAFDKQYPPDKRCDPAASGCWRAGVMPDRVYAFSADGIFHTSDLSRAVTRFDVADPIWHRLGFINEMRFNWYPVSDVQRARRDGRAWKGYDRWHLTMPWFTMIRLPAAYVGGQLCWTGDVLWEGAGERFAPEAAKGCRTIVPDDAGRRVVGVGIKPDTLTMHLEGPLGVRLKQWLQPLIKFAAIAEIVLLLIRLRPCRATAPLLLLALAIAVIAIDDASFLGGVRPFDGGDDGMFYDSVGRDMLQAMLAGHWRGFLEGGESIFYYGGPALRYFRALEHIVFGDTYLGYLSLVLVLSFIVLALFRRFLPSPWPLAFAILFLIPIGTIFGTSFIDYSKWAARGFADPACYILFMAGLLPLLGPRRSGPDNRFWPAFFGALLIALGIGMKPLVAPAAAVLLGGAGLAALYWRQWSRLAGMCIGFLPVFSMAWHNWVFGGRFVLFSDNAGHPLVLVMPPSAWIGALREVLTLDFSGGLTHRAMMQIPNWLSGPAESYWTVPLNAAGVAMLVYVVVRGRRFDPWLRLVGGAALAQHAVALFYVATARYHFLTWFLTLLVAAAFMQQIGFAWLERRYPALMTRVTRVLWPPRLAAGIERLDGKAG
ncbi:hypothetical protein [Undibacter mobilis]|uniref:Uncharacterized protein n=1 Tax=Undibacter mobilis TaxID=2292256 RepID=A0A371B7N6_9BRAD|nr:hypothetical protein [Undibacter mobilis]RDV03616.1 hypothetical protein DXH78_02860 [Undibacter mobilis]